MNKLWQKIVALLLCGAMVFPHAMPLAPIIAQAASTKTEISISSIRSVTYDGVVAYELGVVNKNFSPLTFEYNGEAHTLDHNKLEVVYGVSYVPPTPLVYGEDYYLTYTYNNPYIPVYNAPNTSYPTITFHAMGDYTGEWEIPSDIRLLGITQYSPKLTGEFSNVSFPGEEIARGDEVKLACSIGIPDDTISGTLEISEPVNGYWTVLKKQTLTNETVADKTFDFSYTVAIDEPDTTQYRISFYPNDQSPNYALKHQTVTLNLAKGTDPDFEITTPSVITFDGTDYTFDLTANSRPDASVTYQIRNSDSDVISIEGNSATIKKTGYLTIKATQPAIAGYRETTAEKKIKIELDDSKIDWPELSPIYYKQTLGDIVLSGHSDASFGTFSWDKGLSYRPDPSDPAEDYVSTAAITFSYADAPQIQVIKNLNITVNPKQAEPLSFYSKKITYADGKKILNELCFTCNDTFYISAGNIQILSESGEILYECPWPNLSQDYSNKVDKDKIYSNKNLNLDISDVSKIYLRVADNIYYIFPDSDPIDVSKATAPNIIYPTATNIEYGQALSESVLQGGSTEYGTFAWADGTHVLGFDEIGTQNYTVIFTPSQDTLDKYETITNTQQTVAVEVTKKAQSALSITSTDKATYGDAPFTLATKGGNTSGAVSYQVVEGADVVSVDAATGKVTILGAGSAKVTATMAGDANYQAVTCEPFTITVKPATPTIYWATETAVIPYSGSAVQPSTLVKTGIADDTPAGTISYTYKKQETGLRAVGNLFGNYQNGLPTEVGTYLIKAHIAAAGNYTQADSTNELTLTIVKETPTLTITSFAGKTYDGTAIASPTAAQMTLVCADYDHLTFTYSKNADMSEPLASAPINAGTYYVQANVASTSNTNAAQSAATVFTISPAPLSIESGVVESKKWDGTTTATVTGLTFGGLATGETLNIATDYSITSAAFEDAAVGTAKNVTVLAALKPTDVTSNYTLASTPVTITGAITLADGPAAPSDGVVQDNEAVDYFSFASTAGTIYEHKLADGTWTELTAADSTTTITVGNVALAAGQLQVRVKETATHKAGDVLTNSHAFTAVLEGTATVTGLTVYGETLTANAIITQADAVLAYTWKTGDTTLGTGETYVIGRDAVGKAITIEVTATDYIGTLSSAATAVVAPKTSTPTAVVNGEYYFTGSEIKPTTLVVKDGDTVIKPTDYDLSYLNNTNVGTAAVAIVTLKNIYKGTQIANFTILGKPLTDATVTVNGSYTYTGSAIEPTDLVVKDGDTVVAPDNYTLSYANNINAGIDTATVIVTFKNNYSGTASTTFTIQKAAAPAITFPTADMIVFGATLASSTLTGGSTEYGSFAWKDGTTIPTVLNEGFDVIFTPNADTLNNYEPITTTSQTIALRVITAPAQPLFDVTHPVRYTDTSAQTVSVAGKMPENAGKLTYSLQHIRDDSNIIDSVAVDTTGNVRFALKGGITDYVGKTATVTVSISSDNYSPSQIDIVVTLTDKEVQTIALSPIGSKTYGDAAVTVSLSDSGSGTGAVTYTSTNPNVIRIDGTTATIVNAGNATIIATKTADAVYAEAVVSESITVSPKAVVAKPTSYTIRPDQSLPTPEWTVDTGIDGETLTAINQADVALEIQDNGTKLDTVKMGTFDIVFTTAPIFHSPNYTVTIANGTLTVKKAASSGSSSSGGSQPVTDSTNVTMESPKTGDNNNVAWICVLLAASSLGIAIVTKKNIFTKTK